MEKSRLYEVYRRLSKAQIKELRKFVRSPFFNQRDHVVQLFVFLERERKRGNDRPDRRKAFAFIWPTLTYDDHKLRLSMSLLYKVIEQYLAWGKFQEDEVDVQLKLVRAYRQLGLERHFTKTVQRVADLQSEQPLRHAEYYQNRYAFYLEQYHFNAERRRMEGFQLAEVQENLDVAYLAAKLRQSCLMLSHQAVYKKDYDFGMLEAVIDYLEARDAFRYPAVSVYYHVYKALTLDEGHAHFAAFKTLIFTHRTQFPQRELRDLFLLAANYCIRQLNRGHGAFARIGLDIYQEGLKDDTLLRDGILSNFTYSNIVAKAIVSKEYAWAGRFVRDYKDRLEPKHRESSYAFNLAWLEYEQQHYDRALTLLNTTHITDLLLNIAAKTMAMKIYYELGADDLLASHLDAMRTFLHRKKILTGHQRHYLNTIKYLKKIMDLPPADRARRERLAAEIEAVEMIAEREWLLRQTRG